MPFEKMPRLSPRLLVLGSVALLASGAACSSTDSANPSNDGGPDRDTGTDAGIDTGVDAGPRCGDGIINGYSEECDLGGGEHPGCDAKCQVPEITISVSEVSSYDLGPAIAASPAGGYVVAWATSDKRIVARRLNANGVPIGDEQRLDSFDNAEYLTSRTMNLTASPDGFLASWIRNEPRLRAMSLEGTVLGDGEHTLSSEDSSSISDYGVTLSHKGHGYSVLHYDFPKRGFVPTDISPEGVPGASGDPVMTFGAARGVDGLATAAMPDGSTVVAWKEFPTTGNPGPMQVRAALVRDGKAAWTATLGEPSSPGVPAVAVSNEGKILVVWREEPTSGMNDHVIGAWLEPDGRPAGRSEVCDSESVSIPSVTHSTSGGFLVTVDGHGKRFTSKGEALDSEPFQLTSASTRPQAPNAVPGPDGTFMVVYRTKDPYAIRARLLPRDFRIR